MNTEIAEKTDHVPENLISFGGMLTTHDGAARLAQRGLDVLDAELAEQGEAAYRAAHSFKNACAHEAGHVIVRAAHGQTLKVARVFERKMTLPVSGRKVRAWLGWNESANGREVFCTADDVERHARITIAGYMGEELLRGTERLCGSSLDERLAFVHLARQAAGMRGEGFELHTARLMWETRGILKAECEGHKAVYEALRRRRELRSKELAQLVEGVEKCAETRIN